MVVSETRVSNTNPPLFTIGLMSGTSVDGIDAALVRTDGYTLERVATASSKYRDTTRDAILAAYKDPQVFLNNASAVKALSISIAQDHAVAVEQVLNQSDQLVSLLGFHGQTILHLPDQSTTVQLGDALTLANQTHVDTVYDFRSADIQAGGHGAPLAPIYHQSLMQALGIELPAVILNIGGVANLSYWDGATLVGFDTGPGNGLLDQYMQTHFNCAFDESGKLSSSGHANKQIVNAFLALPYFKQAYPKSLDRSDFNAVLDLLGELSHADAMASLCALTVQSVKLGLAQLDKTPVQLIVCGGGQHNQAIIDELKRLLNCTVNTADSLQLPGDYIEAELMGFLAARYYYNLPATFPHTTGVSKPSIAGRLQRASCL